MGSVSDFRLHTSELVNFVKICGAFKSPCTVFANKCAIEKSLIG